MTRSGLYVAAKPRSCSVVAPPPVSSATMLRVLCHYRLHCAEHGPPGPCSDAGFRVNTRSNGRRLESTDVNPVSLTAQGTPHQISSRQDIPAIMRTLCGHQVHGHGGAGINDAQRTLVVNMRCQHGEPTVYAHTLWLSVATHQTKTV